MTLPAKKPLSIVLPKPENSLKALAATGANPKQMLWGMVWTQTLPKVCNAICKTLLVLGMLYLTAKYGPMVLR